ncbi:MAG: hypothetical protein IID39_08390 [Planctomycetes bacterium]|nr:hypothetical protein [Planctomycetota bacterium]
MKSNTRMGIDFNGLRMLRFGFHALAGIAAMAIVTASGCVDVVPGGVSGGGSDGGSDGGGTSGGGGGDVAQVGNPLLRIAPGDHVLGSEEAEVTVIEYGDFH